jgi:hypothetical protein
MYAPPAAPPPPKRFPTWLIVILAVLGACGVLLPILAVLAVYGVRKYLAAAKTAEARNALGQIAKDAATAYERDGALCASALQAVPASMTMLRGTKYHSAAADWQADASRRAGFACLGSRSIARSTTSTRTPLRAPTAASSWRRRTGT